MTLDDALNELRECRGFLRSGYAYDLLGTFLDSEGEELPTLEEADALFRTLMLDEGMLLVDAQRAYTAALVVIESSS